MSQDIYGRVGLLQPTDLGRPIETRKTTTSVSSGPKECVKICLYPKLQELNPCPGGMAQPKGNQPAQMSRKPVENWLQAYMADLKQQEIDKRRS